METLQNYISKNNNNNNSHNIELYLYNCENMKILYTKILHITIHNYLRNNQYEKIQKIFHIQPSLVNFEMIENYFRGCLDLVMGSTHRCISTYMHHLTLNNNFPKQYLLFQIIRI